MTPVRVDFQPRSIFTLILQADFGPEDPSRVKQWLTYLTIAMVAVTLSLFFDRTSVYLSLSLFQMIDSSLDEINNTVIANSVSLHLCIYLDLTHIYFIVWALLMASICTEWAQNNDRLHFTPDLWYVLYFLWIGDCMTSNTEFHSQWGMKGVSSFILLLIFGQTFLTVATSLSIFHHTNAYLWTHLLTSKVHSFWKLKLMPN